MSHDEAQPDPSNGHVEHDEQLSGAASTNGEAPAKGNWEQVEEEYRRVIAALNADPVSFTVRSAEGVTLYGGLDTHNGNGNMRKLADLGHSKLLKRVQTEKKIKTTESPDEGERDDSDMPSRPAPAPDQ
jgi:hypothetical protein